MITFNIPPKPGEVTLTEGKLGELLMLRGHTQQREALITAAGFSIGALLMNECETTEDASEIIAELVDQAHQTFDELNMANAPNIVDSVHLASALHYGMEHGRIATVNVNA